MKLSPLGLAILCFVEEPRLTGFPDSGGVPTAGYGHTGPDVAIGVRYTVERIQSWLATDVGRFEQAVESLVKIPLTQHQFDALVIFAYNVGTGAKGLAGSSLLRYLNADDAADAATQFAVWDKVRGLENVGLERRRAIEKALFLS
jgi:lysozyme